MAGRDRREDPGQYYPGGRVVPKTPTGQGGGGTSDYDQLANKPKINNHEMTGNKTAAQLGLATPEDIPDVTGKLPLRALPKYLHFLAFDDTYPEDAAWLYAQLGPSDLGRCSAVRRGGKLWRNYDWTFDFAPEFVIPVSGNATRFASTGIASVGSRLTENDVMSAVNSRYYKCLPGMTLDGINEKGVVCEINVDGGPKTGWHGDAEDDGIHILAAVRWVLDHGETAQQAAEWLADHIIQPTGEMNFHFMVADATKTYIVENGEAHDVTDDDKVLTNFAVFEIGQPGEGVERYNLLRGGADISAVNFTNAYQSGNNWDSDFESAAQHAEAIRQWAAQGETKEAHRGKTTSSGKAWWQSVHTTEYDFAAKTMKVAVQEVDDWYTFAVDAAAQSIEIDNTVTRTSANPVKSSGIWSAIWGALTAVPAGFSSLYDWCVAKLGEKRDLDDLKVYEKVGVGDDWTWTSENEGLKSALLRYSARPYKDNYGLWMCTLLSEDGWYAPNSADRVNDGEYIITFTFHNINTGEDAEATATRAHEFRPVSPADFFAKVSQLAGKQDKITSSGVLKGDGSGGVTSAEPGADYLPAMNPDYTGTIPVIENDGTLSPTSVFLSEIFSLITHFDEKADKSDIIDPALAAAVGKIADAKLTRDFVNLMVSTNSAHYLTARAGTAGSYTYPPFASAAALRAALASHTDQNPQFFYAGEAFTPTKNDWVIVSEDEDHPLGTIIPASRYGFVGTFGSGGSFQYQVSYKLPLTTAQIAALDSGATATRLSGLESDGTATDDFATDLLGKQASISAVQNIVNGMFDNGDTTAYPRTTEEG